MSTICMKIDPNMPIGLHLVFVGKTGVTVRNNNLYLYVRNYYLYLYDLSCYV
jgi:hypothetical protein